MAIADREKQMFEDRRDGGKWGARLFLSLTTGLAGSVPLDIASVLWLRKYKCREVQ